MCVNYINMMYNIIFLMYYIKFNVDGISVM